MSNLWGYGTHREQTTCPLDNLPPIEADQLDMFPSVEKPSNPKDSVGIKKVPASTIPSSVVLELGLAMLEGARKYGRHNFRTIGVRSSVYYDAARRHLDAWWEGEDVDADSGLNHIIKAIACLVVLRDAMICDKLEDDRPPPLPDGWVNELNKMAVKIIEKYPNPKEAHVDERRKAKTKKS